MKSKLFTFRRSLISKLKISVKVELFISRLQLIFIVKLLHTMENYNLLRKYPHKFIMTLQQFTYRASQNVLIWYFNWTFIDKSKNIPQEGWKYLSDFHFDSKPSTLRLFLGEITEPKISRVQHTAVTVVHGKFSNCFLSIFCSISRHHNHNECSYVE